MRNGKVDVAASDGVLDDRPVAVETAETDPCAQPRAAAETAAELDRYVEFYNRERAHPGYRTQGRTPYQAFLEGVNQMPQDRVA